MAEVFGGADSYVGQLKQVLEYILRSRLAGTARALTVLRDALAYEIVCLNM